GCGGLGRARPQSGQGAFAPGHDHPRPYPFGKEILSGIVLDASVALCWCLAGRQTAYADAVQEAIMRGGAACAPGVWPLEIGQALSRAERAQAQTAAQVDAWIAYFAGGRVEVESLDAERAFGAVLGLARRTGLSTYDASYLELAIRRGWPLATLDADLRKAARRQGAKLFQG